jgi:hypothetical protein
MAVKLNCVILLVFAGTAWGQYVVGARAGTIQFTAGEVFANGRPVRATPKHFPFLEEGQALWTRQGRVEILLGQGVFLRLDRESSVRLTSSSLEDTRIDMEDGRALVEVVKLNKAAHIQVRLRNTITEFRGMGVYRFDLPAGELRVFAGEAGVSAEGKKVEVTRGKAVRCDSDLALSTFDLKNTDGLHEWSARRSFVTFFTQRLHQTMNWEIRFDGSAYNRDFDRKYYLRNAARAFIRNQEQ